MKAKKKAITANARSSSCKVNGDQDGKEILKCHEGDNHNDNNYEDHFGGVDG